MTMVVTPTTSALVGTDSSVSPLSQGRDSNTATSLKLKQFERKNTNQDPQSNGRQPHESAELEDLPQHSQSQSSGRVLRYNHSHPHRMSLELEEIQQQTPGDGLNDESDPLEGQTQETFTQHELSQTNGDLTQLGIDDDESDDERKNPCCSPAPIDPLTLPWGRLMPVALNNNPDIRNFDPKSKSGETNSNHPRGIALEMTPRSPTRSSSITTRSRSPLASSEKKSLGEQSVDTTPHVNFLGLKNLRPSDRFNEYIVGRSVRCDATVEKLDVPEFRFESNDEESKEQKIKREAKVKQRDYVHSMISNRHCRIYCLLNLPDHGVQDLAELTPSSTCSNVPEMEVFVEDTSGNGTLINGTILLSRNERRKLHTGDVICLINPKVLAKRVRSTSERKIYMSQYSYVFVNLYEQEARNSAIASDWSAGGRGRGRVRGRSRSGDSSLSPAERRRIMEERIKRQGNGAGKVNVRALKCHSINFENNNRGVVASGKQNLHSDNPLSASLGANLSGLSRIPNLRSDSTAARRIEEDYDLRDLLGSGTCGEVRRAIHRRSGEERAVKIISISGRAGLGSTGSNFVSSDKLKAIQAEAEILRSLDHPYIVKLYDVYVSPGKAIYLVMELVKGGEMFDRIVNRGKYTEVQARRVFRRILTAVHHLHEECQIVHRDLKPENILMVDRRSDVNIKISDFGVAKNMTAEGLKTFCGTPLYFAPEVISRQNTVKGKGRYGKEADCWSIGVILYIILCGSPPFDVSGGFDVAASADIVFYKDQWKEISREARELVIGLLEKDPRKRLSVKDACDHAWVLMDDGDTHTHPLHDPAIKSRQESTSTVVATSANFVDIKPENGLRSRNHPSGVSPVTVASQLSPKNAAKTKHQVSSMRIKEPNSIILPVEKSSPPESQTEDIDTKTSIIPSSNHKRTNSILISEANRYHVSNAIHQAPGSVEEHNHSSPIKRRKLFPMTSGHEHGQIRKMTKDEVDAIRNAGISVPKPCLKNSSQNENKQGVSVLINSNQKIKKKVQQSLFKTSSEKKFDSSDNRISTFSLHQHKTQPKTYFDIAHSTQTKSSGQPINDSSNFEQNVDLSDDELQSNFSFDEEDEAIHDQVGLSGISFITSLGKGKSVTSVASANKRRQLVQTFLFGKPPPSGGESDSNGYAERNGGVGTLVIAENHATVKKIDDPKELQGTNKLEQHSSGGSIKTMPKTSHTQKTLKDWFQPKK